MEMSGALTPAQPPPSFAGAGNSPASGSSYAAAMMRSASDLPGGPRLVQSPGTPLVAGSNVIVAPGSSNAPEPRDLRMPREQLDLDESNIASARAAPYQNSKGKTPQMEHVFLKRIEALEQKVVDRDGLVAKLTHQQARLDRLETLARENEILKAQMRGEQKRNSAGERGNTSKDLKRFGAPGKFSTSAVGGQNRSDNGRSDKTGHDPSRELASSRRVVSPPADAEPEPEASSSRTTASGGLHQVTRSSSGIVSPGPPSDRAERAPPRRMVSAPQDYVPPPEAKVVTASDLESRLEELELALGLQPGMNVKCNGIMREKSA